MTVASVLTPEPKRAMITAGGEEATWVIAMAARTYMTCIGDMNHINWGLPVPLDMKHSSAPVPKALPQTPAGSQVYVLAVTPVPRCLFLCMLALFLTQTKILAVLV